MLIENSRARLLNPDRSERRYGMPIKKGSCGFNVHPGGQFWATSRGSGHADRGEKKNQRRTSPLWGDGANRRAAALPRSCTLVWGHLHKIQTVVFRNGNVSWQSASSTSARALHNVDLHSTHSSTVGAKQKNEDGGNLDINVLSRLFQWDPYTGAVSKAEFYGNQNMGWWFFFSFVYQITN